MESADFASDPVVGIIANPASGKDIRRLVARGSVFDNVEKANIVRRTLVGLLAVGVRRVLYMPEYFGIVERAIDGARSDLMGLVAEPLDIPIEGGQRDSTLAARALAERAVGAIVTLGGDGTNRAVAKGSGSIPLLPISTGTNNVFPTVVEGTLAGMAAGLVARAPALLGAAVRRSKLLEILLDAQAVDVALVDVALSTDSYVGSRAVWNVASVRELVLAIAEPATIGLSAIGAGLSATSRLAPHGLHVRLARDGESPRVEVLAPIAPGVVAEVGVADWRRLDVDGVVQLTRAHGTLALDGEREIVVTPTQQASVRLTLSGPRVIDVTRALEIAAREGLFLGGSSLGRSPRSE